MSSGAPPLSQAQPSQSPQQAPVIQETMPQVLLQTAGIEERLQHLANGVNQLTTLRGEELLSVDLQILQSWCHNYPGHGTKIMRGKKILYYSSSQLTVVSNSSAWHHDRSWSSHQNYEREKDGTYYFVS